MSDDLIPPVSVPLRADRIVALSESGVPSCYVDHPILQGAVPVVHNALMQNGVFVRHNIVQDMLILAAYMALAIFTDLPSELFVALMGLSLLLQRARILLLGFMYRRAAADTMRLAYALQVVRTSLRRGDRMEALAVAVQWLPPSLCPCNNCMEKHRGTHPHAHPAYIEDRKKDLERMDREDREELERKENGNVDQ